MPSTWTKESSTTHGILSQSLQFSQFKEFFFGLCMEHFGQKYSLNTKPKDQVAYEIAANIVLALQSIRLIWYPDSTISEWESYRGIWKVLGYISYDSICAESGLFSYCLLTTFILIAIEFVFIFLLGFSTYTNKKFPYFVTFIPKAILFIFTVVGIIPTFMLLIVTLKYYWMGSNYLGEYGIRIKSGEINVLSAIFCIFSLILLLFILFFSEIFSCDMKHSHHRKNIKSRSSSELDLQIKLFYIILCLSYVSFGSENIIPHQILAFFLSLALAVKSIFVLHYYNAIGNWIQSSKMMIITTALLIFLFGEVLDNSEILLVFNIILQPIVIYFTIKYVLYRQKNLREADIVPKNQFEFERKYRYLLMDKSNEENIETLILFERYWSMSQFVKNKIFIVWEFNYCRSIVKNERLARVKLSKIFEAKYSFEGDIQEWKIFYKLEGKKSQEFADINFLEFLQEFCTIKFKDEKLCNTLVDLHNEFSLRNPSIAKLIHLTTKSANKINKITEGYKKLIDIHKNVEAYEHYSSFLENIAGNIEEASLISKKKDGLNFYSQRNEYQSLENYGKTVGIMLISCAEENFGMITYINETAAQTLKTSIINANGTPFTHFIPAPFDALHGKSMKKFVEECVTTDFCSHKSLFFQTISGFLIECNIMIKLTAFRNDTYLLVSFKPISSNRQIALLSQTHNILNHSELFCYFLNSPIKIASGRPLSELAPYLNVSKMINCEPLVFKFYDKEIAFVHIQKTIESTTFSYLLVIDDEKEIKQWKLKENENQLELYENSQNEMKNEISSGFLTPKNIFSTSSPFSPKNIESQVLLTTNKYLLNIDHEIKKTENQIENPSKLSSSRNSNSKGSNQAKRLLLQSKRKINVLQWVLFIMMISVIITMVAMLAYIAADVSRTSRMSSLGHLGSLLYYFEAATESIRTLEKASKSSAYTLAQMESFASDLSSIIDEIDIIRNSILDDFELWTYCDASKIIQDPIVPLWNFDTGKPAIEYDNLYNAISRFIDTGKKVIGCVPLKQSFTLHTKFLYLNGLSYAFDFTNRTTHEIVDCEINRVKTTGENIQVLIAIGLMVLGILAIIIFTFILSVSKSHDGFWNFMLNHAQLAMVKLRNSSIDRLMLIHGTDCSTETSGDILKNAHIIRKTHSSLHLSYAWRILAFFIIAASYYFLVYFYIYRDCEEMMMKRPSLLNNFNLRRVLISRLSIFSRESYLPYMNTLFSTSYAFSNPQDMVDETYAGYVIKTKELRSKKFFDLMSQELIDKIYETATSDANYTNALDHGSYPLANDVIDEIYSLKNTKFTTIEHTRYSEKITVVQDEILQEFKQADHDSKNIISGQLNIIINTTVIYSLAVLFLFFFYYWPFFIAQSRLLNKFSMIQNILMMEAE